MPSAEIITIGTELLLGEIQDTNTRDLAVFLKNNGISLFRATIVGDNLQRIAIAIREALMRVDLVITAGGLGPTIDDPTRAAVALAVERETVFIPELWAQIEQRFKRFGRRATENNRKQAYIPQGAIAVENQVGTAPAFIVEENTKTIISLPGVPRELHYLLENKVQSYLQQRFSDREIIKTRVLHTAGVGESQVDEWVADLETYTNPTVGLLAHPGLVDVRITARAASEEIADLMIAQVAAVIYERLNGYIFGENGETLELSFHKKLTQSGWKVAVAYIGMDPGFEAKLAHENIVAIHNHIHQGGFESTNNFDSLIAQISADAYYEVELIEGSETQRLNLKLKRAESQFEEVRSYGGPPLLKEDWAANQAIDFLRRHLK